MLFVLLPNESVQQLLDMPGVLDQCLYLFVRMLITQITFYGGLLLMDGGPVPALPSLNPACVLMEAIKRECRLWVKHQCASHSITVHFYIYVVQLFLRLSCDSQF